MKRLLWCLLGALPAQALTLNEAIQIAGEQDPAFQAQLAEPTPTKRRLLKFVLVCFHRFRSKPVESCKSVDCPPRILEVSRPLSTPAAQMDGTDRLKYPNHRTGPV